MPRSKQPKLAPIALNPVRAKILDWARDHNLVIHPATGYEYYVDGFATFHACPCDQHRKECPCPESIEECAKMGHCLCHLFWRDIDTFKKAKLPVGL